MTSPYNYNVIVNLLKHNKQCMVSMHKRSVNQLIDGSDNCWFLLPFVNDTENNSHIVPIYLFINWILVL